MINHKLISDPAHSQWNHFLWPKTGIKFNTQSSLTLLIGLSFFALPLGVSLKSIFIIPASVVILFHYRHELIKPFKQPWFLAAICFFLVIVAGCFISPADKHSQFGFIHKYSKLLFLPLFALAFQDKSRRFWAIHAFFAAMLLTFFCSVLKWFGLISIGHPFDAGAIFYNHIITSYCMSFAAFLAAINALRYGGKPRLFYILLSLIFSFHVFFLNTGRTGYLMFTLLLLIFLVYFVRSKIIWFLAISSFALVIAISPVVKSRLMLSDHSLQGVKTSLNYRMQFHQYAQELFLRSPLFGLGTGAFSYYFVLEKPIADWSLSTMEPHGEYWLIACEHGLIGLISFFAFILSLVYAIFRMQEMRVLFIGLLVSFLIGCVTDGFLVLSGPGYFFILFAAMGLGESLMTRSS